MRRQPIALASGLALAYSLALLGDQMLYVAAGEGLLHPAVVVWTGDAAPPELRGLVMGGLATAGDLGAALGPLVGYALLESAGLRSAYGLCAGFMLSALLALVVVRQASVGRVSVAR